MRDPLLGVYCYLWDSGHEDEAVAAECHMVTRIHGPLGSRKSYHPSDVSDGYDHARPVELGHPDPNHPSHKKEPKMTELEQARKAFNDLDKAHKEMGDKLKALEEAEKRKRPKLSEGQVWAYKDGRLYVVVPNKFLVNMDAWFGWCGDAGFGGNDKDFTYIGLAKDILTVNLPKA